MTSLIGEWAKRPLNTRWHLIESQINDEVDVRCGRRLRPPLTVQPIRTHDTALRLCFYCDEQQRHRPTLNTRGEEP